MKIGFDTNVFIYSFDRTDQDKHRLARRLLDALIDQDPIVPMQVVSEALNAAHRKRHLSAPDARSACEALAEALQVEPATPHDALVASCLTEDHKVPFIDAQMVAVHTRLGVDILLSEDLQDGRRFGALRIVNPFSPANADETERLISG